MKSEAKEISKQKMGIIGTIIYALRLRLQIISNERSKSALITLERRPGTVM